MEKCKQFALSGYGYVQDINLTGEVATLRIEVTSLSPDASDILKDQIIIECKVLPRLRRGWSIWIVSIQLKKVSRRGFRWSFIGLNFVSRRNPLRKTHRIY